jgi:hypothetical protein
LINNIKIISFTKMNAFKLILIIAILGFSAS